MNIIHLFPEINKGGTERIVLSLAHQQKKKHNVTIVVFSEKDLYPDLTKGLNIVSIKEPTFVEYSMFGIKKRSLSDLTEQLLKLKPDIIHSHSFWTDLLLLSIPKFESQYISHFHLYNDLFDAKLGLSKKLISKLIDKKRMFEKYRRYNVHFISISKNIDEKLRKVFPLDLISRFHLIQNAIDLPNNKGEKIKNLKTDGRKFTFLNVSRLEPSKNHLFIIQVVEKLLNRGFVNFNFLIAGEGSQREKIEKTIEVKKLKENISLLGNIDDVKTAYLGADLYVHSSQNETFGLTFVEALSYGLPCLGLKAGGNEDIIVNGHNGFLVENNVDLFVNQLLEIMTNEKLYNHLASHAVSSVQHFDMDSYTKKVEILYQTLLSR